MSWQPLAIVRQTAGALLFVRTWADLGRAIDGVNELRSYRPSRLSPDEEVLGVALCEDVDSIPAILGRVDSGPPHGDLALREAVGLGGVWSLCSFDIMTPRPADHRRASTKAPPRLPVPPRASRARRRCRRRADGACACSPGVLIQRGPRRCRSPDGRPHGEIPPAPHRAHVLPVRSKAGRARAHRAAREGVGARRGGSGGRHHPSPTTLTPHLGTEAADDTF
jgi:hypothetical protein